MKYPKIQFVDDSQLLVTNNNGSIKTFTLPHNKNMEGLRLSNKYDWIVGKDTEGQLYAIPVNK